MCARALRALFFQWKGNGFEVAFGGGRGAAVRWVRVRIGLAKQEGSKPAASRPGARAEPEIEIGGVEMTARIWNFQYCRRILRATLVVDQRRTT